MMHEGKEYAHKADHGKTPVFRGVVNYFPRALDAVGVVSAYGLKKYGNGVSDNTGWLDVRNGQLRYSDAMMRHLIASCVGETTDPESRCLHLAHMAWNALAVLEIYLRGMDERKDEREGEREA
jgi:hypothetical protein